VGRARVGRAVGVSATPDRAVTSLVKVAGGPGPPVFVDESGLRRRRLRRLTYAVGLAALLALVLLWVSQLTGALRPDPVAPCPPGASAQPGATTGAGGTAAPGGACARR
jgi:hypothetical protein